MEKLGDNEVVKQELLLVPNQVIHIDHDYMTRSEDAQAVCHRNTLQALSKWQLDEGYRCQVIIKAGLLLSQLRSLAEEKEALYSQQQLFM